MAHPTQVDPTLTFADLRTALRAALPGAVLVPTWVLREVIVHDRSGRARWFVPRQRTHMIECARAEALASQERLPIDGMPTDQQWLALLPEPEGDWLASTPAPLALRHYWRLLFRTLVSAAMRGELGLPGAAPGPAGPSRPRQRALLGRGGLHEIRQVLHEERLLPSDADDSEVHAEFVAVFLELFYFDRPMLRRFFPMLPDPAPVLEWIGQAVDAASLWRQTRLDGAADPAVSEPADAADDALVQSMSAAPADELTERGTGGSQSRQQQAALFAAADRAAARGNHVRAAVLHTQAFELGGTRAGVNYAGRDLDALAERLASVPEIGRASAAEWRQVLRSLLAPVARGWWNHQARLLYDLQKVCINNEREIYSVNLVEWALDFARRPLRRPLPRQRLVLMIKHLHSARSRLTRMNLSPQVRLKLTDALSSAAHAAEASLHEQLYPVVLSALQASGLEPSCHAEIVALNKLVEELLDTVVRKGFLSLGDLRDAISRNAMKLNDLRGPGEFIRGDELLRIDQKLAVDLDGVYRRGEVYRRWFQRVSSLLYADRVGRWLTRTLLIPLGGAFLVLEGLEHTIGLVIHLIFKVHPELGVGVHGVPKNGEPLRGWKLPGLNRWIDHPFRFLAVAALFFLLANWPAFRVTAGLMLRRTGHAFHWLLVAFPGWFASQPMVQAIANSRVLRMGLRYVVKPFALAWVAWKVLPGRLGVTERAAIGGGAFVAANLLLNSRRIRALEGALLHRLRIGWERLTGNILAGLYHLVMGFFEAVLEDVDRMLYQVDEWLRFRSGQGRAAFVAKALLGVCWFYAAYFVRFVMNLLIEPQLNPIKHFPVVTVSHKIILPQTKLLADAFVALGLAPARAIGLALPIIFLIPGMFGFLAWELLSNWKLYKANRPPALRPVPVGSHGESVARLLRPGIHSGTIPKIFARLRRAAAGRRSGRRTQKHLHALEHVREAVEHFLERELVARLGRHPAWEGTPVELGEVSLTPSSIVIELLRRNPGRAGLDQDSDNRGTEPMRISFRNWSGWIVAGIDEMGWAAAPIPAGTADSDIAARCPQEAALLSLALAGLYKLAGVDLVREQVDSVLATAFRPDTVGRPLRWDISRDELLVWAHGQQEVEAAYSLADGALQPTMLSAWRNDKGPETAGPRAMPSLDSAKLMLRHVPIGWEAWLGAWEMSADPAARAAALNGVRVLPEVPTSDLLPVEATG